MIEDAPLVTIRRNFRRPAAKSVKALMGVPAGYVADAMDGRGALDPSIKPVVAEHAVFCGVAIPCQCGPADNLAVFAALQIARPGDVIVAATDGHRAAAVAGDLLVGMIRNRGAVAFVTDGCVRDIAGIREVGIACFATGITPNSPARNGPGSAGLPVALGGAQVDAGDLLVGDENGVVVIPRARVDAVIAKLADVKRLEAGLDAQVRAGLEMPDFIRALLSGKRIKEVD